MGIHSEGLEHLVNNGASAAVYAALTSLTQELEKRDEELEGRRVESKALREAYEWAATERDALRRVCAKLGEFCVAIGKEDEYRQIVGSFGLHPNNLERQATRRRETAKRNES